MGPMEPHERHPAGDPMPLISIIIPTYNRRQLLAETMRSVFRQTETDWEMIVVDDASPDDTSEYIRANQDPRVRGIRLDKNGGQSAARQHATPLAGAPYIFFLDDDDLLRPQALQLLLRALVRRPDAVAAVGANVEFDARGHARRIRHPRRQMTRVLWPELLWGWSATPSRVLVGAEKMVAAGGWDPSVSTAHDTDLWLRMSVHGPFVLIPQTVVDKRAHPDQSRPADERDVRRRFRETWFASLSPDMQARAKPVLAARDHTQSGDGLYQAGQMSEALKEFTAACTSAPILLRSPLVRPYLTRDVAKAAAASLGQRILGSHATESIRARAKLISAGLLKRDPGGDRTMKRRQPRPPPDES